MTSSEIDEYVKLADEWQDKFGEQLAGFGFGLTAEAFPSIRAAIDSGSRKPLDDWWKVQMDALPLHSAVI